MDPSAETIRTSVKERYAKLARSPELEEGFR